MADVDIHARHFAIAHQKRTIVNAQMEPLYPKSNIYDARPERHGEKNQTKLKPVKVMTTLAGTSLPGDEWQRLPSTARPSSPPDLHDASSAGTSSSGAQGQRKGPSLPCCTSATSPASTLCSISHHFQQTTQNYLKYHDNKGRERRVSTGGGRDETRDFKS